MTVSGKSKFTGKQKKKKKGKLIYRYFEEVKAWGILYTKIKTASSLHMGTRHPNVSRIQVTH